MRRKLLELDVYYLTEDEERLADMGIEDMEGYWEKAYIDSLEIIAILKTYDNNSNIYLSSGDIFTVRMEPGELKDLICPY